MNTTILKLFAAMCLLAELASAKLMYVEVKYPLLGNESPPGSPWPMPLKMDSTSGNLLFLNKNQFQIFADLATCDIIQKNIAHYMNVIFPPKIYDSSKHANIDPRFLLNQLYIRINSTKPVCPGYPDSNMDESYEIKVSGPKAQIVAPQVWGAIRGLETFSQLTFFTDNELLVLNDSTRICDQPRFKYRGLLIDTARHFIPVPVLKKQLDGMSYNKFNILHWHIVDDQSYPYESLLFPDLTRNGAYSKAHVYTQKQIREIIDHARLRGIRVIPEFDSPGHVESFGRTFRDLMTVCWNNGKPFEAIYSVQGKIENLDPTNNMVYSVWNQLLGEASRLFVDDHIHLGNDEVYYECWKSNPNITEWMKRMNFTEYHELQAFYSSKLVDLVKGLNKKVTVWQDVYDNGVRLEKDTHIQIWRDTETISTDKKWYEYLNEVTQDGYQAILSSPWYINFVSYGYKEWFKWYEVEPLAFFTGTDEQAKLLIGGEAALWSEYVDGTNIETRLWPRASPIAERLWSQASVNNSEDAKFRLDEHRCRLLRRGIPASPVLNGYCGPYEYGMEKSVIFDPVFNYGWPTL